MIINLLNLTFFNFVIKLVGSQKGGLCMINFEFILRITLCFLLGCAIGLERQFRRRIAGIRTITLVSLGAFLFVSISNLSSSGDVTRIAAQVVSGIGFLGAGVILRDGTNIRGLNTAATLWCSAAIGALTALGLLVEAIVGVAYILLANLFLRFISRKLLKSTIHTNIKKYTLNVLCKENSEDTVKSNLIHKLKVHQISIKSFSTIKVDNKVQIEIQMEVDNSFTNDIDSIITKLCVETDILSVNYSETTNYMDDDEDYEDKYDLI